MTKRDYIRAAKLIQAHMQGMEERGLVEQDDMVMTHLTLIHIFIKFFEENPLFDAEKFRKVCKGGNDLSPTWMGRSFEPSDLKGG